MGSEVLLLGYGVVCLSMIFFNILQSLVMHRNDLKRNERSLYLEEVLAEQFRKIENKIPADEKHYKDLGKLLKKLPYLLAFDRMLENGDITIRNTEFSEYLNNLQPVLVDVAKTYMKREEIQAAYYAHFLTKHRMIIHSSNTAIQQIMMDCMKKKSLYCRVNGFRGLCMFGEMSTIVEAVKINDQHEASFHGKLLTEILLTYTGEHNRLITEFWKVMKEYSIDTKVALMNYIRLSSGDYSEKFLQILRDTTQHKELRLAAVRYLGRHIFDPAKQNLIELVLEEDDIHWEYAAIAASALAKYSDEEVVAALTKAMSSSQWFVRFNAANSLKAQRLDYEDLIEVVHKGDRYAREMVMYRLMARERDEKAKGEQP